MSHEMEDDAARALWVLPQLFVSLAVAIGLFLLLTYQWRQNLFSPALIGLSFYAAGITCAGLFLTKRLSQNKAESAQNREFPGAVDQLAYITALCTGSIWSFASLFQYFFQFTDPLFYLSLAGLASCSGLLYWYQIKAALANVGLILLPATLQNYLLGQEYSGYIFVMSVAYLLTLYWILSQLHGWLDKYLGLRSASRISEIRETEKSRFLGQQWQETQLAAVHWDRKLRVIDLNPAAEQLFGYSKAEAMNKHADFFVAGQSRDEFKKMWRELLNSPNQGSRGSCEIQNKSGSLLSCEWNNATLLNEGKLVGVASYISDITAHIETQEKIQHQAIIDSLTGLPNRRAIMDQLGKAIARCNRTKQYASVIFIDLDNFKDINDTRGHDVGDLVLRIFAKTVRQAIRQQDMVARFGGDEFVILIEDLGNNRDSARDKVYAMADKIMELARDASKREGLEYEIEVSCGLVMFNNSRFSSHDILKQADLAMYRVKNEGRKGCCFYDDSLAIEAEYRVTMIHELRKGLENKEFDMHFQPIMDSSGNMACAESLLRWSRPSRKVVPASEFIDFIASLPMINEVGLWIFERVCKNIVRWRDRGIMPKDLLLFINISPQQFHDDNFADQLKSIVRKYEINPAQLVLEITEESLIHDLEKVQEQLEILIDFGLRIALDDFGTGYSSLAMLQKLPVHYVKLDREFNIDIESSDDKHSIVRAVVKLCEILKLEVIAEGVETEEQYLALKDIGCSYFQGFYFNKPMPASDLTKLLEADTKEVSARLIEA